MKAKLCILTAIIAVLGLILIVQVKAANYSWRDDFNYGGVQDLQNAGWTIVSNPSGVSLSSGTVLLDGTSADTSIIYSNHFPAGIYDWTAETRAMWQGQGHSQPIVSVFTDRHSYAFTGDGWYSCYDLYRDSKKIMTFGSYSDQANVWVTLRMAKQGNTISMYRDGALVRTYTEEDTVASQLTGVGAVSPWEGNEKFEYYQISDTVELPAQTSSFPWLYVAAGGIATIAVVGAAVYFVFIAGGGAGAASIETVAGTSLGASAGSVSSASVLGAEAPALDSFMYSLVSDTVFDILDSVGYGASGIANASSVLSGASGSASVLSGVGANGNSSSSAAIVNEILSDTIIDTVSNSIDDAYFDGLQTHPVDTASPSQGVPFGLEDGSKPSGDHIWYRAD